MRYFEVAIPLSHEPTTVTEGLLEPSSCSYRRMTIAAVPRRAALESKVMLWSDERLEFPAFIVLGWETWLQLEHECKMPIHFFNGIPVVVSEADRQKMMLAPATNACAVRIPHE